MSAFGISGRLPNVWSVSACCQAACPSETGRSPMERAVCESAPSMAGEGGKETFRFW